jgi:hypothetical protein
METEQTPAALLAVYWTGLALLVVAVALAGLNWPALAAEALALLGR